MAVQLNTSVRTVTSWTAVTSKGLAVMMASGVDRSPTVKVLNITTINTSSETINTKTVIRAFSKISLCVCMFPLDNLRSRVRICGTCVSTYLFNNEYIYYIVFSYTYIIKSNYYFSALKIMIMFSFFLLTVCVVQSPLPSL